MTIDDAAEQAWLQATFQRFGSAWIGLTDQAVEGTWTWADGTAVSYTNWQSGQPYGYSDYDHAYLSGEKWYSTTNTGLGTSGRGIIEFTGADSDADGLPDVLDAYPADPYNNWTLQSAGADGVFDTADDGHYRLVLATPYTGGTTVQLRIEGGEFGTPASLGDGQYRFTANTTLTDLVGNVLDGNGDGTGGEAYSRTFTIDLPAGQTFEGENNDSQLQATLLPMAEDPAGSGLAVGFGVGRQDPAVYQNTWSDPDWWRVELQAGDLVSVSVDTPASNVDSYVELYNAAGQQLTGNDDSGPDADAFISHYAVTESGSYYVRVGKGYYSSESGDYALRVERARGIQLESDASYQNDAISGANALALTQAGTHQTATVAGTVMAPSGSNLDEDVFALGVFNTGNVVELNTRLPGTSTLVPKVTLLDAAGQVIADSDGNPGDGHVLATLAGDGAIYARVESGIWEHGGHRYVLTDGAMTWTAAEAYAQTLGGHLVTVDDAAEQAWLTSNFGGMSPWIGFTDQAVEGTWVWFERDGGGLHQLGQQRAQHVLLLL